MKKLSTEEKLEKAVEALKEVLWLLYGLLEFIPPDGHREKVYAKAMKVLRELDG